MKLIIEGGNQLAGELKVYGSKNAALPLISASLLIEGKVILKKVPMILDVLNLLKILEEMGVKIRISNHLVEIDSTNLKEKEPNPEIVGKLRGSILLLAPLLMRFGRVEMAYPGGDVIGVRPINVHLEIFEKLGVQTKADERINLKVKKLTPTKIILQESSVTATENALMCASLIKGKTEIHLAAMEPHVSALARFLKKAGANIRGIGTPFLIIEGRKKLKQFVEFEVPPDYLEAGTFIALALATKSEILIKNIRINELSAVFELVNRLGGHYLEGKNSVLVKKTKILRGAKIQTGLFPKLATDLQAPFGVVATQAQGFSLIHDWLYEDRLSYLKELKKMGANVEILDPHRAIVIGPTRLVGKEIDSLDIRSGIALLIAGLTAEGKTIIHRAEIVNRGYENIDLRLNKLGAKIKKED